jgi:hypothetical protein
VTQGQLVMVLIIEDIEEIAVEGMDVFHLGEVIEDVGQSLRDAVLAELDLNGEGSTLRM